MKRSLVGVGFIALGSLAAIASAVQTPATAAPTVAGPLSHSPIKHVVVILQENHSFNDLLGRFCADHGRRCAGTTVGTISDGTRVDLTPEPDIPPAVEHGASSQVKAMDGGLMDGWDRLFGCGSEYQYRCLMQAQAGAVPNLWSLADAYAVSDRTFETGPRGSWGSHLQLVASTIDGFTGEEPNGDPTGRGTGCDTRQEAPWTGAGGVIYVPSCIPDRFGNGPFRPSPVRYVPTVMDRMDGAGLSWHIYAPTHHMSGYGWAICPTFYECLGGTQHRQMRRPTDFATDAANGRLPSLSIVIPTWPDSQHNGESLIQGDNWVARNVSAVMSGRDWGSTAIFITYDDCGCFYDPVPPPVGAGIRVPMVIVSPWVRAGYTDHRIAVGASLLAFTEHLFGLAPLSTEDAGAYDYAKAFRFGHAPLPPIPLPQHTVPLSSLRYIAEHPPDLTDPT